MIAAAEPGVDSGILDGEFSAHELAAMGRFSLWALL
jgi:hypothetical protein